MTTSKTRVNATIVCIVAGLSLLLAGATVTPAQSATAGQISTRNIILGAVAVTAAVVLYNEYRHAPGTIVGRAEDGGRVYIDGRVIFPDGSVIYLSNDGRRPCDFYGDEDRCSPRARGFVWRYDGEREWHGEGLHRGWEHGHGNPHHDENEGGGS